MNTGPLPPAVTTVVSTLSDHPAVTAITIGGSCATGTEDEESDVDIEVFLDGELPRELRHELALEFDQHPEIDNAWFGPADEWCDRASGIAIDIAYFERGWFEGAIRDVIQRHRPALGYTTAFWHTLRHAEPVFDRADWLAEMKALAHSAYPDELRRNIVAWNHPVLRGVHSSYRHQIELAVQRDDPVSVNHRAAAMLASVFDIIFALARALHPGEKRLLAHVSRLGDQAPHSFEDRVRAMLHAVGDPVRGLLPAIDDLCDTLDEAIRRHGLADVIAQ